MSQQSRLDRRNEDDERRQRREEQERFAELDFKHPMKTIKSESIKCKADEASAITFNFEHDGIEYSVLTYDKAGACLALLNHLLQELEPPHEPLPELPLLDGREWKEFPR